MRSGIANEKMREVPPSNCNDWQKMAKRSLRRSRQRYIEPHQEAGYTSAVMAFEPEPAKPVAIGRGPYTSTHGAIWWWESGRVNAGRAMLSDMPLYADLVSAIDQVARAKPDRLRDNDLVGFGFGIHAIK